LHEQLAQHLRVRSWVGWGKLACWRTKATISLKRVKIEKKLLWRAYRNSSTLFRTIPFRPPYGLLFPKFPKFATPPPAPQKEKKLQSLLSQERVKLRTSNLSGTFMGSIRTKPDKKFCRKGSVSVSRDCQHIFGYPLLSQEPVKL